MEEVLSTVQSNSSTNGTGSSLSSFEEFCGNSPFWDKDLLLDSPYPRFTECFRQIAVTWIPCMLYIVACGPYMYYLCTKPTVPNKIGLVGVAKMICLVCLLGITIATIIVRADDDDQDDIPDALYVSEGFKAATFLLCLSVGFVERQKGVVASSISWIFWFLLVITNIIPFYSNFKEDKQDNDKFGFVIFICYYAFVILSFIIASFVEKRLEAYQEISRPSAKLESPEFKSSIPSRLSFWWMNKLVIMGYKKTLEEDDIYDLNPAERLHNIMPKFLKTWEREQEKVDKYNRNVRSKARLPPLAVGKGNAKESTPLLPDKQTSADDKGKSPYRRVSVIKAIMIDHGPVMVCALIIKAGADCFLFLTPKITEALIEYITYKDRYHEWRGYALAASYLAVTGLASIVSNHAILYTRRSALRMKASLVNALYRKSLTAASIGDETTKGEINNLMSISTQKLEDTSTYIHFVVSAPAQVCIAFYLLYEQLGVAVFAGMGVMFLTFPLNVVIGWLYEQWQNRMMKRKDERNGLLSEILNGIKVLKLYAWEISFQDKVKKIRDKELKIIINIQYLVAIVSFFFKSLPHMVEVTAFAVYINREGYLDPSVAFVSLQLFNMLNTPLMILPLLIPSLIQLAVALNRISSYLNKPDIKTDTSKRDSNAVNAVEIRNGNFTWSLDRPMPTLQNINMEVAPGSLVAVVGTVGCGKSSLISAILGEMEKLNGDVVIKGTTAYVPQEAWIQNATLRSNITFGQDHRPGEYDKVIEACALKSDLAILPGGDMTEIGEKGINISGGQKQRVSLARAVYSNREIFLLDDPLSAVDSHVGSHIFQEVIGENGVLSKKTRILVTHGVKWLPMVDKIFVMTNGQISESGTYSELQDQDGDFARFLREYAQEENQDNGDDVKEDQKPSDGEGLTELRRQSVFTGESGDHSRMYGRQKSKISSASLTLSQRYSKSKRKSTAGHDGAKLTEEESSMSGRVKAETYLYYFKHVGTATCILAIVLFSLEAGCTVFSSIWLTEWTEDDYLLNRANKDTDKYGDKTDEYLIVFAFTSIGGEIFILIFFLIAAVKLTGASRTLHNNMLVNVLRSPMSFFDTTPTGRILNRFAMDIEVVDQILPMSVNQILNVFSLVIVTIVNISYGTPIFLVALAPLTVMYMVVQTLYMPTCRQLRRIESITRSPIYVHFSETLNGSDSIRAYGCQKRFIEESIAMVDHNMKFAAAEFSAFCWLTTQLNFLGNMVVFLAAIFAVAATDIDPSVVGLSVSYASSMTASLEELVNGISELETNIVAVERIKEYSVTDQEAEWSIPESKPNRDWPDKGHIVFDDYQTRYRPGLDLVLKNVTCTIKGGEKIGIVGRTGAGKTSMTVALFRLIEAAGGRIVIDGEDVSRMGLHDLRGKLTILPQEPVIFCGTMRMNLDPFNIYTEPELWNALEHSYLKDFAEGLPGKLEYECGEEGSNLSVGQRQLLCLARTLLRKTKILVLDEATAAVDMETDDLIQKTIRKEFKDCTILTIAHRLNTVMDYDRIMVLDKGNIAELDTPANLIADDSTIFHGMAKEAGLV